MPPRPVVAAVILGWLATIGWLASGRWSAGSQAGDRPALVVDLADEVAPQHATWHLYRGDRRAGTAETHLNPRKDGLFTLTTRLRDLELDSGDAPVKVGLFLVTRTVTREGDLVSLDARANIHPKPGQPERKVDASLKGDAVGDEFRLTCEFDTGGAKTTQPLEPIPAGPANAFAPFQPLPKYPPLRPGQAWESPNIDAIGELLHAARPVVRGLLGDNLRLPSQDRRPPSRLAARVQDRSEEVVTARGQPRACRVIVFEAGDVIAKTWVDIADGKVWRQEANGLAGTIAFVRD